MNTQERIKELIRRRQEFTQLTDEKIESLLRYNNYDKEKLLDNLEYFYEEMKNHIERNW